MQNPADDTDLDAILESMLLKDVYNFNFFAWIKILFV